MTQSEAFERQVVRSSDATALRGKLVTSFAAGVTPSQFLLLNPNNLGARAAAMAGIFSHYRFKYLKVKYTSGTSSYTALGVYDEGSFGEGQAPVNVSDVAELRASGSYFPTQSVPTYFEWIPADPKFWFYCNPGASGSDPRLTSSGVMISASAAGSQGTYVEIDFSLVFKGAVDSSANG
jgi:hypothetical protein